MIKYNDKVEYIGNSSSSYLEDKGGKKGLVVSEPYQLSSVPGMIFVDVEWYFAPIVNPNKTFISDSKHTGHVVNIDNLRKLV